MVSPWVPWEISSPPRRTILKAEGTWRGKPQLCFSRGQQGLPRTCPAFLTPALLFFTLEISQVLHVANNQSPVSLDSGNARAACTGKGTGTQLGRSRIQQPQLAEVLVQKGVSTGATTWAAEGKHS